MLCVCIYNSDPVKVEYFESNGLQSELKSFLNKLSIFMFFQELSIYKRCQKNILKQNQMTQPAGF
uniref:Uncharacterized protein n=1 Tax=Acanthochromis polyacanthus TaxID=80966 RepID=A0A3Q1EAS9_9TELE